MTDSQDDQGDQGDQGAQNGKQQNLDDYRRLRDRMLGERDDEDPT